MSGTKKATKAILAGALMAALLILFLPASGGPDKALAYSPPRVVLTFDDGYNFDHRILDFLTSRGITATAFVIGSWAQNNPSLLREMNGLGWEICNHTQNHPWLTKIPDQQIRAEVSTCQSVISSITGQYQPFFRPPGGFIDNRVRGVLASMGYIPVMWSFDSMDALGPKVPPVQTRVTNMVNAAGDGSVILFHFGGRNTYDLVTGVVDGLQRRGFCFVTLGELYGIKDEVKGGESGPGQAEAATRFYFAEGTTRPGFEEWLLVMNPGKETARLQVTLFSSQGKVDRDFTVPPRARLSIAVSGEVPWSDDHATVIESSVPVAAERMIYFNRGNGYSGGCLSPGVRDASTRYYFAEGNVGPGFEEWLALFNPSEKDEARVAVELRGSGGKAGETTLTVPPLARVTARVNDLVAGGGDLSMILRSSAAVVAERSQYFVYADILTGAHSVPGSSEPHEQWYFAEGTTRSFFQSYLVLFNPCRYDTWLKVGLLGSDGEYREETVDLAAGERVTLHLNQLLPADIDYSIHVSSLLPVLAERSTYFQSHNVTGGYCSRGTPEAREYWLFPEGCTASGFQEWLALFNPANSPREVTVEYWRGGGEAEERTYVLPPRGRMTIDVGAEVGQDSQVCMELRAPGGVVAERTIYFKK